MKKCLVRKFIDFKTNLNNDQQYKLRQVVMYDKYLYIFNIYFHIEFKMGTTDIFQVFGARKLIPI